eukprot:9493912-Lingulodinium_polyedra.AAC.1
MRPVLAEQPNSRVCPVCRQVIAFRGMASFRALDAERRPMGEMVILANAKDVRGEYHDQDIWEPGDAE